MKSENSQLPEGYKQTDVGVIPEDWKVIPLKEISSLKGRIGWQGLKQTEFTTNEDEPFLITGMNFKDGEIRWDEVYHIPFERFEIAKEIQLKTNDVLMTKDGTIGKMLFVDSIPYPHFASLNSHLLLFRPIQKSYFPKFLYYQLNSKFFKDYIEISKSGTTFFGISQEATGEYPTILPPLPEQQAIAEVLSDVDALITSLDLLLNKKRNIKQGTMQLLLTGKKRLPNFSGDWETKTLGEIVAFRNGKAHENHISENGSFVVINSKFVSTEGEVRKFSDICFLPTTIGEIVMVMSDVPNGKAIAKCFYIDEENKYTVNQRICSLKPLNANSTFLFYLIDRNDYYLTFDDGVKQTNLRKDDVLECPLKIPPTVEEQKAIAQILSDMDAEIEALEAKRDKYKAIKQGMMQELLTGKTRLV